MPPTSTKIIHCNQATNKSLLRFFNTTEIDGMEDIGILEDDVNILKKEHISVTLFISTLCVLYYLKSYTYILQRYS